VNGPPGDDGRRSYNFTGSQRRSRRRGSPTPYALPTGPANRLRIIGGRYRGRIVRIPLVRDLRPTPDRVRETLFNWLGQDLSGRSCLELFAGSGALSLEAISRGASVAVAVDHSRAAIDALRDTAATWGADTLEAHVAGAQSFIKAETRRFDVIFLDPPFRDNAWEWLLPACAARLAPDGFVYAEAPVRLLPPSPLVPWRSDKAGQVHFHLFRAPARDGAG